MLSSLKFACNTFEKAEHLMYNKLINSDKQYYIPQYKCLQNQFQSNALLCPIERCTSLGATIYLNMQVVAGLQGS